MTEKARLVCQPVASSTPGKQVDGAEIRWCLICAQDVWVAPTGLDIIATQNAEVVCLDCYPGLQEVEPGELQPPTPEQIAELRGHR